MANNGLKMPVDLAKKFSETLGWKVDVTLQWFDFNEDPQGYFTASLEKGKFLEKADFKRICALVEKDLGGEAYLAGAKMWKVPGPYAKKSSAAPAKPESVSPKPSEAKPSAAPFNASPCLMVPVGSILSMPFQSRLSKQQDEDFLALSGSVKSLGMLQPIVVRPKATGLYEVVAGERRLAAAKKAGLFEVPVNVRVMTDEEAFVAQLTENLQRKDLSEEEKARSLGELARRTGWNAQQIADKLSMRYNWVTNYLPDEFKDKAAIHRGVAGGQALAQAYRESEDTSLRRRDESQETRQGIPSIVCDYCGEQIPGTLVHFKGKFYHEDCAEHAKAEAEPSAVPESRPTEFEPHHEDLAPVPVKGSRHVSKPESQPVKPQPLLTGFEVECPECHKKLLINHVDDAGKVSHEVEL